MEREKIKELESQLPQRFKVVHTLTRESNENVFGNKIRKGRASRDLIEEVVNNPASVAMFVCGPDHTIHQRKAAKEKGETLKPSFMGDVLSYLGELGVPKHNIKNESYG